MTTKINRARGGVLTLILLTAFAGLVFGSGTAQAADTQVTFTKWVTTFPNMNGTIGGDVMGSFHGIVLNAPDFTKPVTDIEADYVFNTGGEHSFAARVSVKHDNQKGTATVTGTVTEGWQRGSRVTGEYKVIVDCAQAAPTKAPDNLCYQGSLRISGS
jgi:hypothetical protein